MSVSDQSLLVARHLPCPRLAIGMPLQHPCARTDGPKRFLVPRRLYTVIYQGAILAEYDNLVVAERVRLPGLEAGPLEHVVDGGRGDGGEDEIAGEDHDGVVGEQWDQMGAGAAEGGPGLVFERAYGGCEGGVGEGWGRQGRLGCHG